MEALWKSLGLTATPRSFQEDMYRKIERALETLLLLKSMRNQSREVNTTVEEAASAISDYIGKAGNDVDESRQRLARLVGELQEKSR